jgi:uncharacterized alpha-E superfamily protein/hemerythrin-like domain-containing protein
MTEHFVEAKEPVMLLSSVAETMFWSGRYMERAQALARSIRAVERLSLDLPGGHEAVLAPLLELGAKNPSNPDSDFPDMNHATLLRALALNSEDPSSVLGALHAARENLRQARVVAPPELWVGLNSQYLLLAEAVGEPAPSVLDALGSVLEAGSRIQGVLEGSMARDAAFSFLKIGIELERADMLLRVLAALLPATTKAGWEKTFDDVRWAGLLSALGVQSMYRRRHHYQVELATLLDFLLVDTTSPRSVVHCLRSIEDQLGRLPRAGQVRSAVAGATSVAFAAARATPEGVDREVSALLDALTSVYAACESGYFPRVLPLAPNSEASGAPDIEALDPFEYLGREHEQVEEVLQVLDELAAQAQRSELVDKSELNAIVRFLTEFGELGHHEKEELILTPVLVENGFDWSEGPVAEMRREHRHEHSFVRVLTQLGNQRDAWSADDRTRFVTDAHELTRFLRSHMDHERRDLFQPATRSLPAQTKKRLTRAFVDFDARQQESVAATRAKMAGLLQKYDVAPAPSR